MSKKDKEQSKVKAKGKSKGKERPKLTLHPRNKHIGRYDLKALSKLVKDLKQYVAVNQFGNESIDFFNPEAVKMLNKALLKAHYDIDIWDIPPGYLCPPIPGRADYIHNVADLLAGQFSWSKRVKTPKGPSVKCLDIGVGANCIYPILGHQIYGWSFVGTDIDQLALDNADSIVAINPDLQGNVELRHQKTTSIFKGIIKDKEQFDVCICNPPFHKSAKEAAAVAARKVKNLTGKKSKETTLNFGGTNNELWIEGGELAFVNQMLEESVTYSSNIKWFTCLIAKESTLKQAIRAVRDLKPRRYHVIEMGQGHKISRILAWTFQAK